MQRKRYRRTGKRTGKFKSGLEETVSKMLMRKDANYEADKFSYVIPKSYTPDFTIVNPSGKKWFLEVKGWMRYEDQQKMKWFKMSNPGVDIRFYFPKDGKVQGSKMLNSEWCEKHEYPYAIGRIPRSWYR